MPNTSRTTNKSTSKSTSHNTSVSTTTSWNTSKSTTTSWTTTWSTSRSTSRTTTYSTSYNTSHTTTYNTSWAVSTSHQTTVSTTSSWNTTYQTTLSSNTTLYTNTNTTVSTALTPYQVTTSQSVLRSTNFFRPKEVSQTNLMLNLDARVSAGSVTWKDQSSNNRNATISGAMGISNRCAALYNFHSDATDLTGNNTGTETAVTYGDGNFGQGAIFNGSSSKIDLPAILPTNSTADSSVSFWFKYSGGQSGTGTLFSSFGGNTSQPGYHLGLEAAYTWNGVNYPDGSLYLTGYSMGTGSGVNGTTSYADGQWHHVVVTYDFSTGVLSCFVDNASSATLSISFTSRPSTIGPFSQSGNIGYQAHGGPHRYAKCSIDQFRIFSKKLDSTEVTQLYNEDSSTFKKIDIFNDALIGHYDLDGTDSFYMTHFITDQNFTIGGWFYRNSAGGSAGYETLWAQGYSPAVRCQIYGADGSANGNRLYIYLHNGSSGNTYDTGIDLPTGEWFHLMKTYDLSAGTVKVYLNSALKKTQSTITGNIYSSGNSDALFRIAKNSSNSNGYINGKISQVRVYDSILTDAQIVDDYSTHDYLYI